MAGKLPILILGYNRPEATRCVIRAIRDYQPMKVYLACDGPKDDRDSELVSEVRSIMLREVDWRCETKERFPDRNLGLRAGVPESISWFFSQEPEGVVLEDDCVPSLDFFRLCEHFLDHYRDSKKVWGITGNNNFRELDPTADSYHFFHVPMIWGWASWSDRWALLEKDLGEFEKLASSQDIAWPNLAVYHALGWKLRQVSLGKLDSWAFPFSWSMVRRSGIWAISNANLVTNIGAGELATNTSKLMAKAFEDLGVIRIPVSESVDERAEFRLLGKTHRVLFPLWLNYLRDGYRAIKVTAVSKVISQSFMGLRRGRVS